MINTILIKRLFDIFLQQYYTFTFNSSSKLRDRIFSRTLPHEWNSSEGVYMQQIWITKAGPPEVLQIREMEDPEPADNEVVIAVESAGINFADIMARLGV